jgi:hypothetical protein
MLAPLGTSTFSISPRSSWTKNWVRPWLPASKGCGSAAKAGKRRSIDGAYCGGHVRPANLAADRVDHVAAETGAAALKAVTGQLLGWLDRVGTTADQEEGTLRRRVLWTSTRLLGDWPQVRCCGVVWCDAGVIEQGQARRLDLEAQIAEPQENDFWLIASHWLGPLGGLGCGTDWGPKWLKSF